MENVKLVEFFEGMINEFCDGNESEYVEGTLMEFSFEEAEKGDEDLYDKDDVDLFFEVREYLYLVGEVKYVGMFNDKPLEYTFKCRWVDIECSFVLPKV